jgi:hypothetical protein
MSQLDFATQAYYELKVEMEEHEQKEPIGLQYDKGDKYYWSQLFHQILEELRLAEYNLKKLLDEQLDEYMLQSKVNSPVHHWNKKVACLLLKERLGLHFSASIKDLFLYVGRSVMGIPAYYKDKVINDFAHALDDWANVDIDVLREAVQNIGSKIEEHCYHCNELMPEFEGTGQPVCSDCA